MLELYVLLTIGTLGYVFKKIKTVQNTVTVPASKKPSMKSMHESNYVKKTREIEENNVQSHVRNEKEKLKQQSEVMNIEDDVDPQINSNDSRNVNNNLFWSPLLEDSIDFRHNNMQPFGNTKQPINLDNHLPIYEKFTGFSDLGIKSKREQSSFFELSKDMGNIRGMQNNNEMEKNRMENSLSLQNNVVPFKQIKVGPGLNNGFESYPMEKLTQDLEIRNIAMQSYKGVNALRAKNNPKMEYKGQVIESGLKEVKPAIPIPIAKNRPEKTRQLSKDDMFKTTGAYLKPILNPKYDAKETKKDVTKSYTGNPVNTSKGQMTSDKATIRQSNKISETFNIGNLTSKFGKKDDYGKTSIQIYNNNRDTTNVQTYKGGLTTAVKAIVAPLLDVVKPTKKDSFAINKRQYGQMQMQIPEKGPIRQIEGLKTTIKETTLNNAPNMNLSTVVPKVTIGTDDIARVTIKETMLDSTESMNLKGPTCITVYDPSDVARVTMKQTTLTSNDSVNLSTNVKKSVVYDDEDLARTTLKETVLRDSETLNMKNNVFKGVVYDDEDLARMTVKETTLNETETMNIKPINVNKGQVYDDTEVAKTTMKETLLQDTENVNLAPKVYKGQVYDDKETTKVTIKETTLTDTKTMNIKPHLIKGVVYDPSNIAKTTHKETLLDHEAPSYLRITEMRGKAVDEDIIAKTTGRETLKEPDTRRITRGDYNAGQAFDIDEQILPTTTKDTLLSESINTNTTNVLFQTPGGYVKAIMNNKTTERELVDNTEYLGGGNINTNNGYTIAKFVAKATNKEDTKEYFGTTQSVDQKPISYEDIYNATLNELRQEVLVNRDPVFTGEKVTYGKEDVNLRNDKQNIEYDVTNFFETVQKPFVSDRELLPSDTKNKYNTNSDKPNELDTSIMNQLKENPYVNKMNI